ncbi:MAG: hypothetical protein GX244_05590, partial [Firmicutes bacterium]|nr:hypothetical protein [Bacillota bacterium]
DAIAEALLEKETLDATEIAALMEGKSLDEQKAEENIAERNADHKEAVLEEKKKEKTSRVKVIFREKGDIRREPREEV